MNPYTVSPYLRVFAAEAAELEWQDAALCAQADPELHFPEKGESTSQAKAVCRACPVRAECLEYALKHDELYGVWGGLSPEERVTASAELARGASLTDIIAADDAAFYAAAEARQEREREQNRKYAAASRARVAALAPQSPQSEEVTAA